MIDFNSICKKWQKKWEDAEIFKVNEDPKKKKYYVLEMYPYPSGSGLHMGHARNYVLGDSCARYKRMRGFNVLYPMGYDSFGLPAENAAIKAKSHPKIFTEKAIETFIRQQKELGLSYDWSRSLACHKPDYYKWDQWIFLKMYAQGLAYKRKAAVNFCPECNTVLANEQVIGGKCWRHENTDVEIKELNQWFFKITEYADELLRDIDKLQWSEDVKMMQRNWIGRSEGTLMWFDIRGSDRKITVFTTRPDTFYGITYLVYAPEHPDVLELVKGTKYEEEVKKFVRKVILEDRFTRTAEDKEKEGMFIGRYAINPITKEEIPIYIANFVLYEYGTGAIIAVPAHDQRDFEFAKKFNIPIKVVINPDGYELNPERMSRAYMGDGNMTNSDDFNGMFNRDAIEDIAKFLEKHGHGKKTVQYKLRDWLISRQRFWGAPIPIIYCDKCGIVPVLEEDLPVILPDDVVFEEAENPLKHYEKFLNVKCPKCGATGQRETDTMDTFVDSSWYFLRYCDAKNDKQPFDPRKANYWMPIDQYIGGREHACGHLIYFRFFTKFLRDLGLLNFGEPALRLFNQGMLHKDGVVMSKSKGNVVIPEEVSKKYGIDTARLFLMFVSSPGKDMEWSDDGVEGSFRFINKFWFTITEKKITDSKSSKEVSKLHKTVKEVTEFFEGFEFNRAIMSLMQFTNYISEMDEISNESASALVRMLAPFTPHICEELWKFLGNKNFVSLEKWPEYDEKLIDEEAEASDVLVDRTRADIVHVMNLLKIKKAEKIKLITSIKWKYVFMEIMKKELENTRDVKSIIGVCMKNPELKKHGQEISKLVPAVLKDPRKIPETVLSEEREFEELVSVKEKLSKFFGADVAVVRAEESKEKKAEVALPGKPAIVIS
ncbi:leucine--tRNA ligase [Candidatus Woesearchaeota archaeon]|nr:leucine--tRNA ligase [Candidatus Woesearchaeota archaeon]